MASHLSKSRESAPARTFVAVELPREVKSRLENLQSEFDRWERVLKWTAPDLLHITLRFLVGVSHDRLPDVKRAAGVAAGAQPFRLTLDEVGAFPNLRAPRVLWVGLARDGGLRSLVDLQSALERELDAARFGRDARPFSPHITLARTRDRITAEEQRFIGDRLAEVRGRTGSLELRFRVSALTVMRSDLGPGGPRYTPLLVSPLGGNGSAPQEHARPGRESGVDAR